MGHFICSCGGIGIRRGLKIPRLKWIKSSNLSTSTLYGRLSQLVENLTFNQGVVGSNPISLILFFINITFKIKENVRMAELVDALDLGSSIHLYGFKSLYGHIIKMAHSTSGLSHHPFTVGSAVRICYGSVYYTIMRSGAIGSLLGS